jgi:hypothetical protein
MTRGFGWALVGVAVAATWVGAQGRDAGAMLAIVQQALGGESKLAAVKTLDFRGQSTRVQGDRSLPAADCEMAIELPDKFMEKSAVAQMGSAVVTRTSGFNGNGVIESLDTPPSLGGRVVIRMGQDAPPPGVTPTPEEVEAMRRSALAAAHEAFARVALGLFAASPDAFPLTFSDAGQAQSPDSTADVIAVAGPDGFAARLFVDSETHLPLMLTWMAPEPLRITRTAAGQGPPPTDAEREQQIQDARAHLRTVEYRLYYGDYRDAGGVKLPHHLQRSIDGQVTEDITFDRIRVNQPIDPHTFAVK